MKIFLLLAVFFVSSFAFSQEKESQKIETLKKVNDLIYQGNELVTNDDYVSAEMAYRQALSEKFTATGSYNLGTSYYNNGNFEEALYRLEQAAKTATTKSEKHKAYYNIGNILMKNEQCKEAVEAFKNSLRNNPSDDESRYNLVIAKKCAEDQEEENEDKDENEEDKQDESKEDQKPKENEDEEEKEGDNKEDQKDEGDEDKKEGEDQEDEDGKPKDEKEDEGQGENKEPEKQKPQPKPGQLSPQQIKNLLEAMNNQEEKVQEKINAEKQKGAKIKTEKDW